MIFAPIFKCPNMTLWKAELKKFIKRTPPQVPIPYPILNQFSIFTNIWPSSTWCNPTKCLKIQKEPVKWFGCPRECLSFAIKLLSPEAQIIARLFSIWPFWARVWRTNSQIVFGRKNHICFLGFLHRCIMTKLFSYKHHGPLHNGPRWRLAYSMAIDDL